MTITPNACAGYLPIFNARCVKRWSPLPNREACVSSIVYACLPLARRTPVPSRIAPCNAFSKRQHSLMEGTPPWPIPHATHDRVGGTRLCADWLQFILNCLDRDPVDTWLSVATVHAIKGGEAPHVILFEFNTFGYRATTDVEHAQDRRQGSTEACSKKKTPREGGGWWCRLICDTNLLYIALTRATESLTLLIHRRSQAIQSPFLPIEMVHYARELWNNSEA